MYVVDIRAKALRQLKKLERKHPGDIAAIKAGILGLRDWPEVTGVKRLTDQTHQYRLRVGNYRIFFDVETSVKIVLIEEVKRRDGNTY